MTVAEGSVAFSFLLLLFSSSPISKLTRDPLYLLDLFLIYSLSKTERSEIKAAVPRQVTLYKQASREPHTNSASSTLKPVQHQN